MTIEQFLARWSESGAAERANKDAFLSELWSFRGNNSENVLAILESLAAVGLAQEITAPAGERKWRALR